MMISFRFLEDVMSNLFRPTREYLLILFLVIFFTKEKIDLKISRGYNHMLCWKERFSRNFGNISDKAYRKRLLIMVPIRTYPTIKSNPFEEILSSLLLRGESLDLSRICMHQPLSCGLSCENNVVTSCLYCYPIE